MKKTFLLLCVVTLFTARTVTAQEAPSKEVSRYLAKIMTIIKKNSLYSDSLNWPALNQEVARLSAGIQDIEAARPVIDTIIRRLRAVGDNHSFYMSAKRVQKESVSTLPDQQPEGRYLGEGLGYIKVPAISTNNQDVANALAQKIQDIIKGIDSAAPITGWVVDLRGNGGGTMYPMIAGLNALVPDGIYGYILSPDPKKFVPFFGSNGRAGNVKLANPYKTRNREARIAVLFDGGTGSSGEMTAISFIGLPNVKTFGQPSAGYTTANEGFKLADGASLLLATAYMADRNHKKYLPRMVPDVVVPDAAAALEAATAWLKQQ